MTPNLSRRLGTTIFLCSNDVQLKIKSEMINWEVFKDLPTDIKKAIEKAEKLKYGVVNPFNY